jgi:RNA polymerase sigma factor (sigma-70 family)
MVRGGLHQQSPSAAAGRAAQEESHFASNRAPDAVPIGHKSYVRFDPGARAHRGQERDTPTERWVQVLHLPPRERTREDGSCRRISPRFAGEAHPVTPYTRKPEEAIVSTTDQLPMVPVPFPPVDRLREGNLLRRFRGGDDAAFGELYETLRPAAQRYARRLVGASDAEDVVADAFAKVFQAIRGGHGPTDEAAPYLMYTVRTTAWRVHRRSNHELDKARRMGARPLSSELTELPDDDLVAALRTLCPRYQQAIWSLEVEGMTATEVAADLGISPNAAAALGYRARKALRSAYDEATALSAVG